MFIYLFIICPIDGQLDERVYVFHSNEREKLLSELVKQSEETIGCHVPITTELTMKEVLYPFFLSFLFVYLHYIVFFLFSSFLHYIHSYFIFVLFYIKTYI